MKIINIKKIGAFVCAAAISVSMVSVMPVVADHWPNGGKTIKSDQVGSEEKKHVLTIAPKVDFNGTQIKVHCGDLYTFTTSFLWYKYVSVENQAYETRLLGYGVDEKMKTRSVRVRANGKTKDKDDAKLNEPCVVGPVECKGADVQVWGYYHYA